jgi:hypothetical protein
MPDINHYFRKLNFRHHIYFSLSVPLIIWSYFIIIYIIYDKTFLKMHSIFKLIIFIPFLFVGYTIWMWGDEKLPMPGGHVEFGDCFNIQNKNIIATWNGKCYIHSVLSSILYFKTVISSLYQTAYGVLLIGLVLTVFSKKQKSVGADFRKKCTFFILLIAILGLTFQTVDNYGALTIIFYYGLSVLTPIILSTFLFLCISIVSQLKYN